MTSTERILSTRGTPTIKINSTLYNKTLRAPKYQQNVKINIPRIPTYQQYVEPFKNYDTQKNIMLSTPNNQQYVNYQNTYQPKVSSARQNS